MPWGLAGLGSEKETVTQSPVHRGGRAPNSPSIATTATEGRSASEESRYSPSEVAGSCSGRLPLARSLGEILDLHLPFYGRRGCAPHDPLAAAIAVGGILA